MEISSSTLTGAMRVGLQVVAKHQGPHLEIYFEVLNQMGPEHEFEISSAFPGTAPDKHKTRFQDIWIQFQLINIGGQRAENIRLKRSGTFERRSPRDFGAKFESPIPQMPPGQVTQLFLLDAHELDVVGPDGRVRGMQEGELVIAVEYDSPRGILNFFKTLPARLLRKASHHRTVFRFTAKMIAGDLPPVRYA